MTDELEGAGVVGGDDGATVTCRVGILEVGPALPVEVALGRGEFTLELGSLLVLGAVAFRDGGIRPGTVTAVTDDCGAEVCGTELEVTGKATSLAAGLDVSGMTEGKA